MSDDTVETVSRTDILRMASDIVSAYAGCNQVPAARLSEIITTVYTSLSALGAASEEGRPTSQKPAVSIRRSITPDHIICLEDGKKLKMLKRHIRTTYNLSPEEYRAKWRLPADYPMVAPNYAKQRSDFAKKIGLGRKRGKKSKPARRK